MGSSQEVAVWIVHCSFLQQLPFNNFMHLTRVHPLLSGRYQPLQRQGPPHR